MKRNFPSVPISPKIRNMDLKPISHVSAWYGRDLAQRRYEWQVVLSPQQITELMETILSAELEGLEVLDLTVENFKLPGWADLFARLKEDLFNGLGFILLRGFPSGDLTPLQRGLGYFGIGVHLGIAIPQNAAGHALGHVCDIGVDSEKITGRGYQSKTELNFHTDSADVVGLLCVRQARSGGISKLVSSLTIYNEMVKACPDLARVLMGPIFRDRREEVPIGQGPWYCIPVFNPHQGRILTTYVRSTVRKAERFAELPRVTPRQEEAMNVFDSLAADPINHIQMDLKPGDIQFVCNHFILHSRTAYEDYPEPSNRRHLLRLHLACRDGPDLPPIYENLRGFNEDGRPAGTCLPGVLPSAPLEPIDGGPGDFKNRKRLT